MIQSIHFDSKEKKVLGLTPTRGPRGFCLKMFKKNKFNQTNKEEMGLIHWGRPRRKRDGTYTLMEAQDDLIWKESKVLFFKS